VAGGDCALGGEPSRGGRALRGRDPRRERRGERTDAAGFNVRTRVHEYGGTPYTLSRGALYFSNFSDQRLYVQRPDEAPVALTPEGYRYADCEPNAGGHPAVCVREDHTGNGEPKNAIVALDAAGSGAGTVLSTGAISSPTLA